MTRKIDPAKIDNIREAAIQTISRQGAANASVASIAEEAGVSAGYLYRYYRSKEAMVNDLLEAILERFGNIIGTLIEEGNSLEDTVRHFVAFLLRTAEEKPDMIRFCLNLQNDLSMSFSSEISHRLRSLCKTIRDRGAATGYLAGGITTEDLYVILICLPLQYIGVALRGIFRPFENHIRETDRIIHICLSAINK